MYDQNNRVCSCSFCFLDLHPKTLASSKAASSSPRYLVGQIQTAKCSFQLMLGSTCFNKIPIWVFQLINMLKIFKVSNIAKWISQLLNIPVGCNSKNGFILHFCVKWTYHQNAWSKKSSFWFSLPRPFWIRFVMSWSSVVGETCFGSKRVINRETSWFAYLYINKSPRMRYIYIHIFTTYTFFLKVYMYISYLLSSVGMYLYWLLYIFSSPHRTSLAHLHPFSPRIWEPNDLIPCSLAADGYSWWLRNPGITRWGWSFIPCLSR